MTGQTDQSESGLAITPIEYSANFKPSQSQPVASRVLELHTYFAQKAVTRSYERAKIALFSISSVLRSIAPKSKVPTLTEEKVKEAMQTLSAAIDEELDRLHVLRQQVFPESMGVTFDGHTKPKAYKLPFYTGLTLSYISLYQKLDELCRLADQLLVFGVFEEAQRRNLCHRWSGRVMHLALVFDQTLRRARNQIIREKKAEEKAAKHKAEINAIKLESTQDSDTPTPGKTNGDTPATPDTEGLDAHSSDDAADEVDEDSEDAEHLPPDGLEPMVELTAEQA